MRTWGVVTVKLRDPAMTGKRDGSLALCPGLIQAGNPSRPDGTSDPLTLSFLPQPWWQGGSSERNFDPEKMSESC